MHPHQNASKHQDISDQNNVITMKYRCRICGYVYDPEKGDPDSGIPPGTAFEDMPAEWVCPVCGASREEFEEV